MPATILASIQAGRQDDLEITPNRDMLYESYTVKCQKLGCKVAMTCFESTLAGEQTYMYSHSMEDLEKRGCLIAKEKNEYLLAKSIESSTGPST